MTIYFIAGVLLGTFFMWVLYMGARRQAVILDEEKQRLYQEKKIVVEFMHNLVEGIGEGVDRSDLFERIVRAAVLSTGASSACVYERVEDTLHTAAVEGLFPPQRALSDLQLDPKLPRAKFIEQVLKSEIFELGEGLMGSIAQSGAGKLICNAASDPRVIQHKEAMLQVGSMVIVPIRFRERVLGLLAVANPIKGVAFNKIDLSLMESLADQAGMAIHNSDYMTLQIEKNKMDFDLSLASSIQGMLLPQDFPKLRHLDADARYRPAQKVGGDLYDIFEIDENRVGIAIADVSGKGVPASLLMAMCQTHLRHFAKKVDSPAEVLKKMNAELTISMRQDMFITFVYAVVDLSTQSITLARAGHELPLFLKQSKGLAKSKVVQIGSEGMALGMVPSSVFDSVVEDITIDFNPGDIFLLYTDGITESLNAHGEEFECMRLERTMQEFHECSAHELNTRVLDRVERFAQGGQISDDLTLLSIKYKCN